MGSCNTDREIFFVTPTHTTKIIELAERLNQAARDACSGYYTYLIERAPQKDSLEEFVERNGKTITIGPVATQEEVQELADFFPGRFPQELQTFFLNIGGLRLAPLEFYSARNLLDFLSDPSDLAGTPASSMPKSLGLLDMIKLSWGNDRFEFDAANGLIQQTDVDSLNSRYACIGWFSAADCDECESNTYVFFNQAGDFGTVFYHQDAFDELWAGSLLRAAKPYSAAIPKHRSPHHSRPPAPTPHCVTSCRACAHAWQSPQLCHSQCAGSRR